MVRHDAAGEPQLVNYQVIVAEEKAILKLDLELLRHPRFAQPRRVLFGARLANVSRGAGGAWVIEFERDSGVFLTDEGAVRALGLGPIDASLREVLQQQAVWSQTLH